MKSLIVLLFSLCFLSACAPSSSSEPANPPPCGTRKCINKPFSGNPVNLNGTWIGAGSINNQGKQMDNLTYTVQFSQMPLGLNVSVRITDENSNEVFSITLTGHTIANNTITDIRDHVNVGSIGADGFYMERPPSHISAALIASGALKMVGNYQLTSAAGMQFSAILNRAASIQ